MTSQLKDIPNAKLGSISTERASFRDRYITLTTMSVSVVAFLGLGRYLQQYTEGLILAKYVFFVLVVLIAPLSILRTQLLFAHLRSPFVMWAVAWIALNMFHIIGSSIYGDDRLSDIAATRIQYLVLTLVAGVVLMESRPALFGGVVIALACSLSVFQVVDFVRPGTFLPLGTEGVVIGRAGSTLINANAAVESLVLLAVLAVANLTSASRFWLLVAVFPGILLTFSRSGILAWLIIIGYCFVARLFSRIAFIAAIIGMSAVLLTAPLFMGLLFTELDIAVLENLSQRLMFFSNLDVSDHSASTRHEVARHAWESFLSNPVIGNGAGFTLTWTVAEEGPHNQHLMILAEYGLAGYLVFLSLVILIMKRTLGTRNAWIGPVGPLLFVIFIWFSFFTHNMFDNLYWLVTFAVVCQTARNSTPDGLVRGQLARVERSFLGRSGKSGGANE